MSRASQRSCAIIALVSAFMAGLAGPGFAWALLLLPAWSLALLVVPRLMSIRPARLLVRSTAALCLVAGVVFCASMLLRIELAVSTSEMWKIGAAGISHTSYRTRSPRYPNAPSLTIEWQPWIIPFGSSFVALGNMADGSSCEESRATWPLVTSTLLPFLVFRQLRRDRVPPDACRECDYKLTGNTSGRCPECRTVIPTAHGGNSAARERNCQPHG